MADGNGWKHGVREMMAEKRADKVAPDYADRLVRKIRKAESDGPDPHERKVRSDKGVPRVLTPRKQARMHELSDEWNGEWSDADMAAAINAEFGTTITPKGINYHTNTANLTPSPHPTGSVQPRRLRTPPKNLPFMSLTFRLAFRSCRKAS